MTEAVPVEQGARAGVGAAELVLAVVLGGALTGCAHLGAAAFLAGIAVAQALFIASWFAVLAVPGRRGALVVLVAAAAASDVVVTQWPHARLGTLLPVLGLAIPVLFAQQLARGVARVRLVESLSGVALAVLAVIAMAAFVQLRHEFVAAGSAGQVASAVTGAATAALVAGLLADMVAAVPRFDPDIPRGLFALLVAGAVGGFVGYLVLRDELQFRHGRSVFVGVACGLVTALLAVASDFAVAELSSREDRWATRARPVFTVLLPLCLLAPIAFLVCLAIRI